MKTNSLILWLIITSSFFHISCKKEEQKTVDLTSISASLDKWAEKKERKLEPKLIRLTPEERAAKLGFAQYLPKDTQAIISIYNARDSSEQLKGFELFQMISGLNSSKNKDDKEIPEEGILEDTEQPEDENLAIEDEVVNTTPLPWTLLGQEITLSFGKSTSDQVTNISDLGQRISYLQAKAFGEAIRACEKTKGFDEFTKAYGEEMSEKFFENLIGDEKAVGAMLDAAEIPPIIVAFRAKEGELEQAAQLVNGSMMMFAMAGEMVTPIKYETAGAEFSGYKLIGEKVAQIMGPQRQAMEKQMSPELVDRIFSSIKRNNITFATGTIGNYVVIAIGGSEESLQLCVDAKESILSKDEMSFADAYADKKIVSMIYGEKVIWNTLFESGQSISNYMLGFRDGISISGNEDFKRDIEEMLQIIIERQKVLTDLADSSDFGLVAYTENGLKVDSFGGYDKGVIDYDTPTELAHLGDSKDNALFFSGITNPAYEGAAKDYAEALSTTLYSTLTTLTELKIDSDSYTKFQKYTGLFNNRIRPDASALYSAVNRGSDALGNETAIVIDLNGSLPLIKGINQEFLDQAKAPRIAILSPVKNRAEFAETWREINTLASSILNKLGTIVEMKIPIQKPMSSQKDDMTTWFYSVPFLYHDFMPSITLDNDWFAASSSKKLATKLISKARTGGKAGNGLRLNINFDLIQNFSEENFALIDKHSLSLFSQSQLEDYQSIKPKITKLVEAMDDFESLKWTIIKENGVKHSSIHLKTK